MRPRRAQNPLTIWLTYLILRAGELTIAVFFIGKLPLWMPVSWAVGIFVLGTLQLLVVSAAIFKNASSPKRKIILRFIYIPHAICAGSAAYFLFVPEDTTYQALLNVGILCMAALAALSTVSDFPRTVICICAIVLPISIRYFFSGDYVANLFSLGGCLIAAALILLARESHSVVEVQRRLRNQAERATEAVAAVNLAKARFFAAVSHDLRQPVHAIGLYAESLLSSNQSEKDVRATNGIRQSWRALDGLLSQVVDLTKLEAGTIEPEYSAVDLHALVSSLVLQNSLSAERKGIRLVVMVKPNCYTWVDELILQRVVSNLLTNAVKFSHENSRVLIALRTLRLDGTITWCLQVRDNGPGIAEENQEKIFEEFVQLGNEARQRQHGMGLGLAIARRFCEVMGCRLLVRSALHRGTCMSVVLPVSNAPDNYDNELAVFGISEFGSSTLPANGNGQKVLLLEDDLLVAESMSMLLREWGYEVMHTVDSMVALGVVNDSLLTVCDVRLPGLMSGLEVARVLKQRGMRVAIITGETDSKISQEAASLDICLLTKPIAPRRLHEAMSELAS